MRFTLITLLILFIPASHAADVRDKDMAVISNDLQVYPLADHIWVHRSWASVEGQRYPANGLIIQHHDKLVLIDTAWGNDATEQLLDWVQSTFGRQPDLAILTHAHADRIAGLPALATNGIPAHVHPETRTLAKKKYPQEQLPEAITELQRTPSSHLEFLDVFYPGPAHSPDNIVVWYDDMKLLFGGCAVKSAAATDIHYVEGSDPEQWGTAIRKIQQRFPDARVVVPGHGPVGGEQLLHHTLELARQGAKH